jgi:adenine-specific DNA methylase
MLLNGLGEALERAVPYSTRFVDLFAGSAAVSWHVAERHHIPVLASDLQQFAVALARGVISRTSTCEMAVLQEEWLAEADKILAEDPQNTDARGLQEKLDNEPIAEIATKARELSSKSQSAFCRAYGGWYYSPLQALTLDALRRAADTVGESELAIASVIQAASICAASPGHTAQPFKPDTRAAPFVLEAWKKDARVMACRAAERLGKRHALVEGEAIADDAEQVAASLNEGDLAFLDPPYSAVHYSRFYHVLESIAQNHVGEVSGAGRYPNPKDRPHSAFSVQTKSDDALVRLMKVIAERGASALLTFPAGPSSNGLSGQRVREISGDLFHIEEEKVSSRFSTLGGDRRHRSARQDAEELILTLRPK